MARLTDKDLRAKFQALCTALHAPDFGPHSLYLGGSAGRNQIFERKGHGTDDFSANLTGPEMMEFMRGAIAAAGYFKQLCPACHNHPGAVYDIVRKHDVYGGGNGEFPGETDCPHCGAGLAWDSEWYGLRTVNRG